MKKGRASGGAGNVGAGEGIGLFQEEELPAENDGIALKAQKREGI